jgi:hypothetical protein
MINPGIKLVFKISLFIIFVVFVAAGIMREEVWDIIANATLICFSCIGIK